MLVLQSYRSQNVPEWILLCLRSVEQWADSQGYSYHLADDEELLGELTDEVKETLAGRWPMLADIGRLKLMRRALEAGVDRVLWLDADVCLFEPQHMDLSASLPNGFAFGREQWIEDSGKVRHGVHNACCVFEAGNPFLEYYIYAVENIMEQHSGEHLAPQLLGPKFLKMQYNLLKFPLLEGVAMLSPKVTEDLLSDGRLWNKQKALARFGAVNLCGSLLDDATALRAVKKLLV
jgi:hypothetical protein